MKLRVHAAMAAICIIATPATWASRITLNDTGMQQCIDRTGDWLSECAHSHQDAAFGRDVNDADPQDGEAGFSFRKVCRSGQMAGEGSCPANPKLGSGPDQWGCTYDNVTGLTWEVKTKDGVHDYYRTFTNKGRKARTDPDDAAWLVDATNAESLCGATNWRLPDVLELHSITNYGVGVPGRSFEPFIDRDFFPHTHRDRTWTRTQSVVQDNWAWWVNFYYGIVNVDKRFNRHAARLVHDADKVSLSLDRATLAADRFVPSADGTEVTDTMTGLVWRRCAAGMVWTNETQSCNGTATGFSWPTALDYVRANDEGGWRLPNVKELFSIVDVENYPAFNALAFPNTPTERPFLSSTSIYYSTRVVIMQVVSYSQGFVYKDVVSELPIRLVRRGRE